MSARQTIPTVKIKNGDSYTVINECDFDPKTQELYSDKPVVSEKKAPKKAVKKEES